MGLIANMFALMSIYYLLLVSAAASTPISRSDLIHEHSSAASRLRRGGEKPLLRITPLGASITRGSDNNIPEGLQSGYRKPLRDQLRYWGYPVNMVGSRSNGDFIDRQHEGWSGFEINGVADKMFPVMPTEKPNLVLILLGSNDCFHAKRDNNIGYAHSAKNRMWTLVQKVYSLSPGVTIILATLPATLDAAEAPYIQAANAGFRNLVQELQGKRQKIELAEMYTDWLKPGDYSDSTHFKLSGYAKIAAVVAEAFKRVETKGWIVPPIKTGIPDNAGCLPSPDGFRGPVRTQSGNGHDDADGMMYCDMYGRGHDDYLWVSNDGNVHLFENMLSPPQWSSHGRILETKNDRKSVHFGDWDGDGLCDVLVVDRPTGNVDMFRNTYRQGAEIPSFASPVRVVNSALCAQPDAQVDIHDLAVRFADLDGDGRVDYICMDPDGRSSGWLNTPNEMHTMPSTIPNQIKIAEGFRRSELRWADVNGDGKADLVAIRQSTSAVQVWINRGIKPALTSSMTWEHRNDLLVSGANSGANVHFPRLSRSRRADYHVVNPRTNEADTWSNEGKCGGGAEDDGPVKDPGLPRMQ